MKNILLNSIFILSFHFSQSQDVSGLLADANKLTSEKNEEAALKKYEEVLKKEPANYEALWNAAFLSCRIGNREVNDEKMATEYTNAKSYAQKALDVNPNDVHSNYVMAVAMGRIALIASAHDRVAASRDIKKYADLALNFDPEFAGGWHVSGLWHHKMANLNFLEKTAAQLLFGGIPDGASDDEAEKCFKQAIRLRTDYMLYYFDLAVFYDDEGEEDKALYMLNKALEQSDQTQDDPITRIKCLELIEEIKE